MEEPNWDERYRTGDLPWDTGIPDTELVQLVANRPVKPCPALELGCGTGTNAIWLAKQGFQVTAVDISSVAIDMAREKAAGKGADVSFYCADLLSDTISAPSFGFVFDRGCFHSLNSPEERQMCAEIVWKHTSEGGVWFGLMGNADGPELELGPPRLSAQDIVSAVEPRFEILRLRTTHFHSNLEDPPRAWACLMRRR